VESIVLCKLTCLIGHKSRKFLGIEDNISIEPLGVMGNLIEPMFWGHSNFALGQCWFWE